MTPRRLLDLWGACATASSRTRTHILAGVAGGAEPAQVAGRPLGEWQAGLLAAWRTLLGIPLDAVANCPSCDTLLEATIEPDDLPVSEPRLPRAILAGHDVVPRLLTAADLDAVAQLDAGDARAELVRRALDGADPAAAAPAAVQTAVATALEEADPSASWWVELRCPDCDHEWPEPLDLGEFLWDAVEDAAGRLLVDVADLAAAFGWSEPDVLALPPARRAAYRELAGQ